jgi:hypothetical protein
LIASTPRTKAQYLLAIVAMRELLHLDGSQFRAVTGEKSNEARLIGDDLLLGSNDPAERHAREQQNKMEPMRAAAIVSQSHTQ